MRKAQGRYSPMVSKGCRNANGLHLTPFAAKLDDLVTSDGSRKRASETLNFIHLGRDPGAPRIARIHCRSLVLRGDDWWRDKSERAFQQNTIFAFYSPYRNGTVEWDRHFSRGELTRAN